MKRVFLRPSIYLSAFVFTFLTSGPAHAQSTGSDEIHLFVGQHLPAGIAGVDDMMPVFGGRYGIATNKIGLAQIGLFNTHALGVDFSTLELGLQGSLPFSPGLDGLYYGGVDLNYYREVGSDIRKAEFGYHAGAAAMLSITDTFWLRGDLKFMAGPGTSLYLLFGFVFRTSSGSSN